MRDLANKDHVMVYLAAKGLKTAEIAEAIQLEPATVRLKLSEERVQFEVKTLRYKLYGKDHKKRFQDILPQAVDVTEQILMNPNTKDALRFQAAQEVMDRALGKPKQTVEHEGSLIRSLFEKLDGVKEEPAFDVEAIPIALEDRIEPALLGNPNERTKKTEENPNFVDDWAKNNL